MKRIFLTTAILACASSAFALKFICGEPKKSAYDVNDGVWSTLMWTTDEYAAYGQAKMSPKGPGPGDQAVIRNRWRVKVDRDVKVDVFRLDTINEVRFEKGKTLETRRDLIIRLVLMGNSFIEFNSGKANIGGKLDLGSRDMVDELGTVGVRLIDSELNIRGSVYTALQNGNFSKAPKRGGVRMFLRGKSSLSVRGIILPDPNYKAYSDKISFNWDFEESGGNIPTVAFGDGTLDACKFSLSIKAAKRGVHTLFMAEDKKASAEMISYTVNRKSVKLGEEFPVGEMTGTLKLAAAAADKDKRSMNDLILEVK